MHAFPRFPLAVAFGFAVAAITTGAHAQSPQSWQAFPAEEGECGDECYYPPTAIVASGDVQYSFGIQCDGVFVLGGPATYQPEPPFSLADLYVGTTFLGRYDVYNGLNDVYMTPVSGDSFDRWLDTREILASGQRLELFAADGSNLSVSFTLNGSRQAIERMEDFCNGSPVNQSGANVIDTPGQNGGANIVDNQVPGSDPGDGKIDDGLGNDGLGNDGLGNDGGVPPAANLDDALSRILDMAAATLSPQGRPVGLVLGTWQDDGYATYYMTLENGYGDGRLIADHLITPQQQGWWHIGQVDYRPQEFCVGDDCSFDVATVWVSRQPEATAAIRQSLIPEDFEALAQNHDFFVHEEYGYVTAVVNGAVCWSYESFLSYPMWAHPSTDWGSDCRWIGEGLAADLLQVDARQVLEPAAFDYAVEELYAAYARGESDVNISVAELHSLGEPDFSYMPVHIDRYFGQWFARTFATVPAYYALTPRYSAYLETGLGPAPSNLTPSNDMPLDADAIMDMTVDIIDIVVSPTHDLVVVLTMNEVIGLDVANRAIAFEIDAPSLGVVMADWALDANAARWDDELSAFEEGRSSLFR